MNNLNELGICNLIHHSIKSCDLDIRNSLYGNIVLSGGNTMFPGMTERLNKELKENAPRSMNIKITSNPNRKY